MCRVDVEICGVLHAEMPVNTTGDSAIVGEAGSAVPIIHGGSPEDLSVS